MLKKLGMPEQLRLDGRNIDTPHRALFVLLLLNISYIA
jgi:hypothetical protein